MRKINDSPEFIISHYCKKLGSKFSKKNPSEIYKELLDEWYFNQIRTSLDGQNIIILCFLLSLGLRDNEIERMYQVIKNNLFCFSFIEVIDSVSQVECNQCNGDGAGGCSDCDGHGELECHECGGAGDHQVDDGGDYTYITCKECGGDGEVNCISCDGNGTVTCDKCDGYGEVEKEGFVDADEYFCVSYNNQLYDRLLLKSKFEPIPINFLQTIIGDKKTMTLHTIISNGEIESNELNYPSRGDLFFGDITTDITKIKKNINNTQIVIDDLGI